MIGQALRLYLLFPVQPHQLAVPSHVDLDTVLLQRVQLMHHQAFLTGQQERTRELHEAMPPYSTVKQFRMQLPNCSEMGRTFLLKQFEQFCFDYHADGCHVPTAFP
jgi:hypothetical protein